MSPVCDRGLGSRRVFAEFVLVSRAHAQQLVLQVEVGGEFRRRHHARDAAVHHHAHHVGDIDGDAEILLDQQHRDLALAAQRLQHLDHLVDDDRRQPFGRLIHDQEPGIEQQRAADRQHLLLAARELAAAVPAALGQAREKLIDARHRPRPLGARPLHQAQMLVDRE